MNFPRAVGPRSFRILRRPTWCCPGKFSQFSLPTLSFSQTTTLESRAEVIVIVKVEETRTQRVVWTQVAKGASEFYVTPDLQFNRVLQNRALEQAGRFVAEDLASRFLLQLESGELTKPPARQASDSVDRTIK